MSRLRSDSPRRLPIALMALAIVVLVVSGIDPYDRLTWWLEVAPVLIGFGVLAATWRRFPLTDLLYALLFVHALILVVGGHYTYARVPLGYVVQDLLDLARNPYDRLGHFAQGFIPAILAREILLRRSPLEPGRWLFAISVAFCLAFSAFYELIEWWVAVLAGDGSTDFLALQGDPWDMFSALIGAIVSLTLLGRWHDRQLDALRRGADPC